MKDTDAASTVVVGIDGSDTAIRAAQWALDEVVSRSATMRLVYVITPSHHEAEEYDLEVHRAKASLHAAQSAVEAVGKPVTIETAVLTGPAGPVLVSESEDADMICVGSVGIDRYARSIVGSTASELAENAHCPVAIIRPQDEESAHDINWIVVAFNSEPGHEDVVEQAMEEARLRHAPVLALGDRRWPTKTVRSSLDHEIEMWAQRYPDVRIYPIDDGADVAHFLKHHDERILLAVVGDAEAGQVAQIVGPHGHHVLHHGESSALVVRH